MLGINYSIMQNVEINEPYFLIFTSVFKTIKLKLI